MKMRTIDQCVVYIKSIDPESALAKTAIRWLVVAGKTPSVRLGQKYLIALENLDKYLEGRIS